MKKESKKESSNEKLTFFGSAWVAEEEIGAGSYGKVYRAKKTGYGLETYCAIKRIEIPSEPGEIKTLRTEGMTQKEVESYLEEAVEKWVDEIKFMSIFKDSLNIVNIEDYEITKKKKEIGWYIDIRMELLSNLDNYVFEHNATNKEIIKMGMDICKALIDCEENDVIHRDIKPENIFVSKKQVYKLGDFGIAKKMSGTVSNLSKKGTENYMAPELYKNEKGNRTVDIYSLGIMLYRFFNYNRLPFLPDYPDQISFKNRTDALEKRISGEKMKAPKNADRDIANIILKACSYYPKDRYQSAKELYDDLKEVYDSITKPEVLFDYNDKNMSKIFKENSKRETLENKTKSIYGEKRQNRKEELIEEENLNEEEIEIEVTKDEYIEEPKIIKNIKEKKNKEKKNNKFIIIILFALLAIGLVVFLILSNKKEEPVYVTIPNVVGLEATEATKKLTELDLNVEFTYEENESKAGKVLSQSIKEAEEVEKHTKITIKVAVTSEKVTVINVVGKNVEEAKKELEKIGLTAKIEMQYSNDVEKNIVISQMTPKGTEVNKGSVIELLVSEGAKTTTTTKKTTKATTTTKKITTTKAPATWSAWVESLPNGVNSTNYTIETKTQYRTSSKETTTGTSATMNGWTKYDEKATYSAWSSNKTTTTKPTANDTLQITNTSSTDTYTWYHYLSYYEGGWWVDSQCAGSSCSYHSFEAPDSGFGWYCSGYGCDKFGGTMYSHGGHVCNKDNYQVWFKGAKHTTTTYTYQTRTKTITYYFYRWGNWSNWSDNKATANDNLKVETKTVYRYKAK